MCITHIFLRHILHNNTAVITNYEIWRKEHLPHTYLKPKNWVVKRFFLAYLFSPHPPPHDFKRFKIFQSQSSFFYVTLLLFWMMFFFFFFTPSVDKIWPNKYSNFNYSLRIQCRREKVSNQKGLFKTQHWCSLLLPCSSGWLSLNCSVHFQTNILMKKTQTAYDRRT